jgi:hypothetical protein
VEKPSANGAYITTLIITLHQHPYELLCCIWNAVRINPKREILKQISFKQMDDDHSEKH